MSVYCVLLLTLAASIQISVSVSYITNLDARCLEVSVRSVSFLGQGDLLRRHGLSRQINQRFVPAQNKFWISILELSPISVGHFRQNLTFSEVVSCIFVLLFTLKQHIVGMFRSSTE